MKNILILYDSKYSNIISNYISLNPNNKYYGLFTNNEIYEKGDNKIINFLSVNDYLNFENLSNIDKKSIKIAKSWYIKSGCDISIFNGISIGSVIEYEIMKIICQNLKSFILLEKIVEKEKIYNILISGNNKYFVKSAEIIAKNKNLIIENFCKNDYKKETYINIKSIIKKYLANHDNYLYFILNIVKKSNAEILFVYSKRNEYLINNLSKYYKISLIALTSIISPKILTNRNITVIQLKPDNLSENENEWIKKLIYYFESYLLESFDKKFIELLLLTDIKNSLKSILNFYLKYVLTTSKYLLDKKYNFVIVGQDFLGIPRLIVECANKLNIKTFVLQHGAYGFYPYFVSPISKYVGIWGRKWSDWLRKIGTDDSKFIITGEPYYDNYLNHIKKRSENKKKILIPFTPNVTISAFGNFSQNELNIIRLLNALSMFKDKIEVILKMRSNNDLAIGKKIIDYSSIPNVQLIGKTNNLKLIKKCDIIITKGSTMAFEGLLLDKIVIFDNFHNIKTNELKPYFIDGFTLEFSTEKKLYEIISGILNNEKNIIENIKKYKEKFLSKYNVKSNSTQRTYVSIRKIINNETIEIYQKNTSINSHQKKS